jgi:hypothetical protein
VETVRFGRQQPLNPTMDRSIGVHAWTDSKGHVGRGGRRRRGGTLIEVGDAVSVAFLPAAGADVRERPGWQMAEEFLLVSTLEAPLDLRTVSATSALGRALVGHGLGDTVEVTTARGRRSVRIVAIRRSTTAPSIRD